MRNKFGQFVKGNVPWTKGVGHSKETKQKISQNNYWKGRIGELHSRWKGNKVGYYALHTWVQRRLGKPNTCEHCGAKGIRHAMQWANISKKYKRELTDWIRLCVKCHRAFDK